MGGNTWLAVSDRWTYSVVYVRVSLVNTIQGYRSEIDENLSLVILVFVFDNVLFRTWASYS